MTLLLALAFLAPQDVDEKLDALVKRLAAEDVEVRKEAAGELAAWVKKEGDAARPVLRKRIAVAKEPEIKGALEEALGSLPVLKLTVEVDGEAKRGAPVKFRVRLKNVADVPVVAVRSLDGSCYGERFPKYVYQLTDPEGKQGVSEGKRMCGNCNEIGERDFVTLKPGEEFDPFGAGGFGSWNWTPASAGTYIMSVLVDFSAADHSLWNGPIERGMGVGTAWPLIDRVPKVRLEETIEVKVAE